MIDRKRADSMRWKGRGAADPDFKAAIRMKIWKETAWRHETTGVDGHAVLFGVNRFDYAWEKTGISVNARDPLYGQDCRLPVYKVRIEEQEYEFAAGEFSDCVWGFYVLKD